MITEIKLAFFNGRVVIYCTDCFIFLTVKAPFYFIMVKFSCNGTPVEFKIIPAIRGIKCGKISMKNKTFRIAYIIIIAGVGNFIKVRMMRVRKQTCRYYQQQVKTKW